MQCAQDLRSTTGVRFGAYLCLQLTAEVRRVLATLDVPALAARLNLRNEFEPGDDHPRLAVAYLRRVTANSGDVSDEGVLRADLVLHVAADGPQPVAAFRGEFERHFDPSTLRILSGVVRPTMYTGTAMHNFAYGQRVLQQPGTRMPNAFLMPLSKTAAWWQKSWMERHTYILPRYDEAGRMMSEGHALVAAPGVPCLLRRTYKQEHEPAKPGEYDFINYFECADADVPTFNAVCAALRDVQRNPEWRFVLEGPSWHGRRVASWQELDM